MKEKKYTAEQMMGLIRSKYSGDAYTVLEQVAAGTGRNACSWIDAAVFSLWPSNGLWRAACEVKVSRADFLNELANPVKNEWARGHFDFFWYVVAPGVAKDDEIPTGCGLMVVRGSGLTIIKQAPRREDVQTDPSIIASFARSLDKERERFRRVGLREALEGNRDFQDAKRWEEGASKYIRECGEYLYHPKDAEAVYLKLREIASSKSPESTAAAHGVDVLERFQGDVQKFLLAVAPFAANIITARDDASKFLIQRYGGRDDESVDALRAALKLRGPSNQSARKAAKRALAVREIVTPHGKAGK